MKTFWQSLNALSKDLLFVGGYVASPAAIGVPAREQVPDRRIGEDNAGASARSSARCHPEPA